MKNFSLKKFTPTIIACSSLLICLILNLVLPAQHDILDFKSWGDTFVEYGPFGFYSHAEGQPTDYPPVYLYFCGLMSLLCSIFNANAMWQKFFFRLPSALILFASVFVFYKLLKHFVKSEKTVLILTILYALAPASVFNVIWGQCDCFTLFYILLACLMFVNKQYFWTLFVCIIALLTKTQFLFILPVFGFAVLWRSIKGKRLPSFFRDVAICVLIYLAVFFPFLLEKMLQGRVFYLFEILIEQVGHYQYYTVNAFNLYMCFATQDLKYPDWFTGVNFTILIAIVVFVCFAIAKNDSDENVVFLSAFILTAIFMLSTNMHERYMLGALGTTIIGSYALKRRLLVIANWIFYAIQFINAYFAWFIFRSLRCDIIFIPIVLSILSVIALVFMIIEIVRICFLSKKNNFEENNAEV